MEITIFTLILYAAIGGWFVFSSKSRGAHADIIFALFWPIYLYHWWRYER